ncbi:hypothetical protein UWK_00667 [Desulfocapsa sulfexigens DSM 10523]|uniref:Lipoprotein n=1 Tax=Desulfocapsa sulfexigens (strain DSM 10523 / SB164P1) TaxID=1167006 RepID=M1P6B1_DESSD|nr:hypothetical protein [Desulfocapsa sulfexigens]AGF77247.1 hypothetical protein UWK_00667 [Desulfocapsa sulfexigens DSM 10523]
MVRRRQLTYPILSVILTLLVSLTLGGCGAKGNVESLSALNDQQGLVAGTISVQINGKDVTNQCALFFNESSVGTPIKTLPGRLFAFDFDQGRQVLTGINYYEGYPTLPLQNLALSYAFNVHPKKTNYLGDIVVNWNIGQEIMGDESSGMDPATAAVLLGPLSGLVSSPKYSESFNENVGTVSMDVSYDADGIARVINNKYGEGLDIVIVEIEGAQLKSETQGSVTQLEDNQEKEKNEN